MGDQARVTSVEAIKAFRARLIVFLSKARPTLEEISNEVTRTRLWLQNDQRRIWENELRRRKKKLDQLEAELFSATLSAFKEAVTGQQMAVRRARESMHEAEHKIASLKKWDRELQDRSEPFIKQVDQLHHYFTTDMTRAVAYLDRIIVTLESYSDASPPPDEPRGERSGEQGGGATSFESVPRVTPPGEERHLP